MADKGESSTANNVKTGEVEEQNNSIKRQNEASDDISPQAESIESLDSPGVSSDIKCDVEKVSTKEDSGVCDEQTADSDIPVTRKKRKFKKTLKITSSNSRSSTGDSGHQESSNTSNESMPIELDEDDDSDSDSDSSCTHNAINPSVSEELRDQLLEVSDISSSSSDSDSDVLSRRLSRDPDLFDPDEDESIVCFIADKFTKPKYKWHVSKEVINRQYGIPSHTSSDLFRLRCNGSLHVVERLELMYKMESHQGCVNSLNFNSSGTRLASGSDDLNIAIWNWAIGESVLVYDSGHRANVFQSKFLPMSGDCHIISCARDGQVRLAELSSDGTCKGTRKVAHHRGSAHKLTLLPNSSNVVLSCGEDANVFEIDLRDSKPHKLFTCKNDENQIPLYAIHAHPMNSNEFIVGGHDPYVRVYDKRFTGDDDKVLKKICPIHLRESNICANVTCCIYNHDGSEILASYNDEDIYLFDSSMPELSSYKHRYQGHRNNKTVKGVNFFGPESQYVVSGSDCGNIYYWEKCSSRIVQCMLGDDGGVVNCLEPHPHLPVMATSGLDDDIKIWIPSNEQPPDLTQFKWVVRQNYKERAVDRKERRSNVDSRMFWFIVNRLHRNARRRGPSGHEQHEDSSNGDSDSSDSNDYNSDAPHNARCVQS